MLYPAELPGRLLFEEDLPGRTQWYCDLDKSMGIIASTHSLRKHFNGISIIQTRSTFY